MSDPKGDRNARWCKEWRAKNPEKTILGRSKIRAAKLGVPFTLAHTDIMIPEKCPACGATLIFGSVDDRDNSPSLDRIVPHLGYTPENTIIICYSCNRIKNNATPEQLYLIADYIYRLRRVRGLEGV